MVYTITVHLRANDDPASVDKLKAKLTEASRVYSQDKETLSWFVMQSTADPRDFTIVERYENEGVSRYPVQPPADPLTDLTASRAPLARRAKSITSRTPTGRLLTPTSSPCWRNPWT